MWYSQKNTLHSAWCMAGVESMAGIFLAAWYYWSVRMARMCFGQLTSWKGLRDALHSW